MKLLVIKNNYYSFINNYNYQDQFNSSTNRVIELINTFTKSATVRK